eukprot:5820987-Lingulodinium_polyedra.AAC.1
MMRSNRLSAAPAVCKSHARASCAQVLAWSARVCVSRAVAAADGRVEHLPPERLANLTRAFH